MSILDNEPSIIDNEGTRKEFELSIIDNEVAGKGFEPSIIDNESAEKNWSIQERILRLQEKKGAV